MYWHRAVNKIELQGEMQNGEKWLRRQVWDDPTLKYLRLARNAGDHGLGAVMQKVQEGTSDPGFMMDIGDGIGVSPRGHVGMMLSEGLGMEFVPEALELAAVYTDRGSACDPPTKGGKPMRALDVGEIGLAFLASAARSVT